VSNSGWEELQLFETPEPQVKAAKSKKSRQQLYGRDIPPTVLEEIWSHYVSTFWTGRGRQPQLNHDRIRLITLAVNQYGADDTKRAITGCSLSEWHMGGNPAGRIYNSLELILRDEQHIERFLDLTVVEDSKGGFLDD